MNKNALDQYMDICTEAINVCGAKLTKSFQKVLIDVILLTVIITGKKNFTQFGRFGKFTEQTYRNLFGRKRSESINWLKLNVTLARRFFGSKGRCAVAIDPSFIKKAGKKTPHIGRFWSGCAQAVRHGLEIMGIGLVDMDSNNCIMLRAHQTLSQKELNLRDKSQVDHYIGVIRRYHKELLKLSDTVVADAFFSTSTFVNGIKKYGFFIVSRLRDNSCLFYIYDGEQKKRGRKRIKGDKIDFRKLDLSRMELLHIDGVGGKVYTLIAYSKALISKVFNDLMGLQRKAA